MKPRKPTGIAGVARIGSQTREFLPVNFPQEKDEVEKFIAEGFLRTGQSQQILPPGYLRLSQNEENNFDFTLAFEGGTTKSLELMEIAPLEHLGCSHNSAPSSNLSYEFTKQILEMLLKKSERYKTSVGAGLILLLYVTAWQFVLSPQMTSLLQYWCYKTSHCFEAIYCYYPLSKDDGVVETIYPTPPERWLHFAPERFKGNFVINFDLTKG